jgi:hypothetical protein
VEHRLLARMLREPVAARRPALLAAEREKPGVLAGAVVSDALGTSTTLEVVLRRRRVREDPVHDRELLGRRAMGRADERQLLVVEIRSRPRDGKRLDRLRRGAEIRDEPRIARGELDPPVANGDRVHYVSCLDDVAARYLHDERFHGRGGYREPVSD